MSFAARCLISPPAALLIALLRLTGCAKGGSELRVPCPPAVEYSRELQASAAEELGVLPDGSAIAEVKRIYGFMQDQARACR